MPHIQLNWLAIFLSMVAAFVFGFFWYGPLFGKPWAKIMGLKMDCKPEGKVMARAFGLQIVGLFLTTFVLAHTCQIWRPSVWGVGQDDSNAIYGFFGGFFTWVGFYVPIQFGKISWENRPWKLFLINSTYDFLNLQLISQILVHIR